MMKSLRALFRYPLFTVLVVAGAGGFIGAMSASGNPAYGPGGAALNLVLAGLFILFPVWVVGLSFAKSCLKRGVSYAPLRFWVWLLPTLLLAGLSFYVAYLSAKAKSSLEVGLADNENPLTLPTLYVYGMLGSLVLSVASAKFSLARISRRRYA